MAELIKSGNLIGSLDVESQMVSLFETGMPGLECSQPDG